MENYKYFILLVVFYFGFIPFSAGAIGLDTSVSPTSGTFSATTGVENYPDSHIVECFSIAGSTNCPNNGDPILDITDHPFTILSYTVVFDPTTSATLSMHCGDLTIPMTYFENYINGANISENLGIGSYESHTQFHCDTKLIFDVTGDNPPGYVYIQYVNFDTRLFSTQAEADRAVTEPTIGETGCLSTQVCYYDWLLVNVLILFAIFLVIAIWITKIIFWRKN